MRVDFSQYRWPGKWDLFIPLIFTWSLIISIMLLTLIYVLILQLHLRVKQHNNPWKVKCSNYRSIFNYKSRKTGLVQKVELFIIKQLSLPRESFITIILIKGHRKPTVFLINMLHLGDCDYLNNYFEITQIIIVNLFFFASVKKCHFNHLKKGKQDVWFGS